MKARPLLLALVLLSIGGSVIYLESGKSRSTLSEEVRPTATIGSPDRTKIIKAKESMFERAKEISTPDGFINTGLNPDGSAKLITIGEFVGKKVMLLDIWTYSCINCQRTTPYLNAWYQKYGDKGLEIIGIHTPEFDFEKIYDNVLAATKKFNIKYPVVLDNDFSTWQAYKNQYWPRKYLIDIDGFIVYDHIGEGGYDETEKKIQELLEERKTVLGMNDAIPEDIANPTDAISAESGRRLSPEIYFGSRRNTFLANGSSGVAGVQTFTAPSDINPEKLYLVGEWNIPPEYAESRGKDTKILFKYRAKSVYIVASAPGGADMHIVLDGKPLPDGMSSEVHSGVLHIEEDRLYKIIEKADGLYGEHTLEINIENPGVRAFTFTFG